MKKVDSISLQIRVKNSISSFFNESEIERFGRISKFIRRRSKLTAYRFLLTLMFSRIDGDKLSLNDISHELNDKFGCDITKQSIDERFNTESTAFMKLIIGKSISDKMGLSKNTISFLNYFQAVRIQDSTSFQLPKNLVGSYGGCAGSASGSLARIQFEYDLKHMNISTLDLTSGSYQDVSYSQDKAGSIKPGELVIRDLGYVSGAFLRDVINQKAYFLNRLISKQIVYIKKKDGTLARVDFNKLLKDVDKCKLLNKDLDVYLKVDKGILAMRLIAEKIPEDIYAKRIRKAEKEAKKKGRDLSKEYKLRARFNLFITNVDKEILQAKEIRLLYSIRWQIELIFKTWKSTFGIAKVKAIKKERLECQLLARLLLIIVGWEAFKTINSAVVVTSEIKSPVILSYYKFNKLILARLESFMLALIFKGMWYQRFLISLVGSAVHKSSKIEPKKKSISSIHVFEMISESIDYLKVKCNQGA